MLNWERPRTERKLNRIKSIYWYIHDHGPVKGLTLAEEYGVTIRTIQRDIDALQANGLVTYGPANTWQITDKKVKRRYEDGEVSKKTCRD